MFTLLIFVSNRAAAFVMRHVTLTLKEKFISSAEGGACFSRIYKLLKQADKDADDVVKFHAKQGLLVIDEFMRAQLMLVS